MLGRDDLQRPPMVPLKYIYMTILLTKVAGYIINPFPCITGYITTTTIVTFMTSICNSVSMVKWFLVSRVTVCIFLLTPYWLTRIWTTYITRIQDDIIPCRFKKISLIDHTHNTDQKLLVQYWSRNIANLTLLTFGFLFFEHLLTMGLVKSWSKHWPHKGAIIAP